MGTNVVLVSFNHPIKLVAQWIQCLCFRKSPHILKLFRTVVPLGGRQRSQGVCTLCLV